MSVLCASTEPVGSSLATDANPFASCSTRTELFIFSEWSIGHSEKIKKSSVFVETQKCAMSSRLQVGDMTHLGRAHRLNCTSLGRACVVITGKVGRQHNEWALTFDKGLRYLSTKGLVSGLCASTEPVGSSLAKWGDNTMSGLRLFTRD